MLAAEHFLALRLPILKSQNSGSCLREGRKDGRLGSLTSQHRHPSGSRSVAGRREEALLFPQWGSKRVFLSEIRRREAVEPILSMPSCRPRAGVSVLHHLGYRRASN